MNNVRITAIQCYSFIDFAGVLTVIDGFFLGYLTIFFLSIIEVLFRKVYIAFIRFSNRYLGNVVNWKLNNYYSIIIMKL